VKIVWDEPKRLANLDKHGLDFADLNEAFFENALVVPSHSKSKRWVAIGVNIRGVVVVVFARLGREGVSIISMRPDPPVRMKGNNMPNAKKTAGYSQKDLRDVSDNPELTKADFARALPFAEAFPDLAVSIRKGRGPNKAPTKKLVSLRLSPEVIEHFKATGDGWQSRIDETLRKVVKRKAS
jgi:uncharacterized DUF497 family protein/uncharacterized protein (DUF4415 family)